MKIKRRKIKKGPLIKLIIVILLLILIIVGVKKIIYLNSDEYKLKEIGYNKKQIIEILKLDKIYKKKIMSIDYNEFLLALFKEKYLITDNIDRYISYQKEHKDVSTKDIVAIVNVNGDYDHYTNTSETNIDDDLLMLVNKYNYLSKDYKPQNIVDVKNWYCYGSAQLREDAYDAFIDMFNSAQKDDITLLIVTMKIKMIHIKNSMTFMEKMRLIRLQQGLAFLNIKLGLLLILHHMMKQRIKVLKKQKNLNGYNKMHINMVLF